MKPKIFLLGIDQMILPLTKKLIARGNLPNLKKLVSEGSANQVLASFPGWTPTNWATISTGADTGTHGLFGWRIDMPSGQNLTAFNSHTVKAETIWEAAEKQGIKSATVHYPASMPSRLKYGYTIDGDGIPGYGESSFELSPSKCYATYDVTNSEKIMIRKAKDWKNLPRDKNALETEIKIITKFKGVDKIWNMLILDTNNKGFDKVLICKNKDVNNKIIDASIGKWSEWGFDDFIVEGEHRKGSFRFKILELSNDGEKIKFYRSQIMPTDGFTYPNQIGEELIDKIGPYQEHVSDYPEHLGWADYETCLQEAEYQAQWFAKAALYLSEHKDTSLFYSHWHFLDTINHHNLAQVDPLWPEYNAETAEKHWKHIEDAYKIIDRYVETILKNMSKDDYIVMVSDHGNIPVHRNILIEKFLSAKGFLIRKDESLPLSVWDLRWYGNIDFEKTKVYLRPGHYSDFTIYVNAEGKEKERIQDEVIHELRIWVDEETKKTPMAIVLKKRDAPILGLWGDAIGDIIYVLEPEYMSESRMVEKQSDLKDNKGKTIVGLSPVDPVGSIHGKQLPTYHSDISSHLAMMIVFGPDIKRGYERPVNELGYIKMVDVVPTLCKILGINPPNENQGTIAQDLFQEHKPKRKLPNHKFEERETDERLIVQTHMLDWDILKKKISYTK